jgi:hypothetical protein
MADLAAGPDLLAVEMHASARILGEEVVQALVDRDAAGPIG